MKLVWNVTPPVWVASTYISGCWVVSLPMSQTASLLVAATKVMAHIVLAVGPHGDQVQSGKLQVSLGGHTERAVLHAEPR